MEDRLKAIVKKAEAACAREEYCDYDMQQKLVKWGAERDEVERVLDHLHEYDFLNNERYARIYCVGKNHQLKWGRTKIAYQLRMKRVGEEAIAQGLQEIDADEYSESLLELAKKKWKAIAEEDRFRKEQKLMGFLQSRGYELNEIYNVIKKL